MKGRREIARGEEPTGRIRRPGAGRPRIQQDQPGIQAALEGLVVPLTRGDPTSPLRWTCKSRAKLAAALTEQGWRVSSTTVGRLLHRLGYRLQSPRKRQEGTTHPDRNAQFEHINQTADKQLTAGEPVISVDTKKKELVADETGLTIEVSHLPPGTSKWNKIEHRLFCHITANWRGTPLTTYETIVDRIGHVRTATGLRVRAELDAGEYPTGATVTKEQMDALALVRDAFHGEWNYKLLPR